MNPQATNHVSTTQCGYNRNSTTRASVAPSRIYFAALVGVASLLACVKTPQNVVGDGGLAERDTATCNLQRGRANFEVAHFDEGDYQTCRMGCNKGDLGACVTLGIMHEHGGDVKKDYTRAALIYEPICEKGYAPACTHLASLLARGLGTPRNPPRAHSLAEYACDHGDMLGCVLGDYPPFSHNAPSRDPFRVVTLFRRACEAGEARGCNGLANLYLNPAGQGVPTDVKRAEGLLENACSHGLHEACTHLARRLLHEGSEGAARAKILLERSCAAGFADACLGQGVHEPDRARAAQILEPLCRARNLLACAALPNLPGFGLSDLMKRCDARDGWACMAAADMTKDAPHRAVDLERRACELGAMGGCVNWARALASRESSRSDLEQAQALLTRACDAGEQVGCTGLGGLYEAGLLGAKDARKAAQIYRTACMQGEENGCLALGRLYRSGVGVEQDPVRAFWLVEQACRESEQDVGCFELGKFYANGIGIKPSVVEAIDVWEHACKVGQQDACAALGTEYLSQKKWKEAGIFLEKACSAEVWAACANLGVLYLRGSGSTDRARGVRLLESACAGRVGGACTHLAVLKMNAKPMSAERWNDAFQLADKGADLQDAKALFIRGLLYQQGLGTKKDASSARKDFRAACDGEHGHACTALGEMIDGGVNSLTHMEALDLYKRGCEHDSARGCLILGRARETETPTKAGARAAMELYEKACQGDLAPACARLGELHEAGSAGTKDERAAARSFTRAVELGDFQAVGGLLRMSTAGWVAPLRLLATIEGACDKGYLPACSVLAQLYWESPDAKIIPRSPQKAITVGEKACGEGDYRGCTILGSILVAGAPGIKKDEPRGLALLERACRDEAQLSLDGKADTFQRRAACYALGMALRRKKPTESKTWLDRACQGGHEPACRELAAGKTAAPRRP